MPDDGRLLTYTYYLANRGLVTDRPLTLLASYRAEVNSNVEKPLPEYPVPERKSIRYQGPGWIGNQWREVTCWSDSNGYLLDVLGSGSFAIAASGETIRCIETCSNAGPELIEETVLGPALILALALHDTWCLHASAVEFMGRAVLFVTESGGGKSTLARFLSSESDTANGWRRVADDVIPITLGSDEVCVLPHFPQLKLHPKQQPAHYLPQRVPLQAVYILGEALSGDNPVAIRPLSGQAAVLALVRHTVTARLFDDRLLARHLDFCTAVAGRTLVRELVYPRRFESLLAVREAIQTDLQTNANALERST